MTVDSQLVTKLEVQMADTYTAHTAKVCHVQAGAKAILALRPFSVFCATRCLSIKPLSTFNKVQYLAEGHVNKVTWV
jgi:hypothetical protein